jgi:hypothetical protein
MRSSSRRQFAVLGLVMAAAIGLMPIAKVLVVWCDVV